MSEPKRLIVGITGASGIAYGVRMLELLAPTDIEVHLVMSKSAELTMALETDFQPDLLKSLADYHYSPRNIAAAISSGSFKTMGMVIAPCSVRTMSEIATGVTSSLTTRAADVVLKERRRLVLMLRETPLHTGHLRTMTQLSEMGAVIAPPVPALYARPAGIAEMIDYTVVRLLDLFDIDTAQINRWGPDSYKQ